MQVQEQAQEFMYAVRLSAEIRALEKTLARIDQQAMHAESDLWHRQMIERALAGKKAQLEYMMESAD